MTVGGRFRRVARILRHVEREGWRIESVRPETGVELCAGSVISLEITCARDTTANDSDTVCPMSLAENLCDFDACEIELQRVNDEDPQRLVAEYVVSVTTVDRDDRNRGENQHAADPPLHRDRPRLRRLYRECETFSAMAEAVEEDVSSETIRRYMIEHQIHSPGNDARSEDGTDTGPGTIDPDEIVATVERSHTLYDVQRSLDLNREEAVALLRQYDLLDLVVGRLDREADLEERTSVIRRRLRENQTPDRPVAAGRNR